MFWDGVCPATEQDGCGWEGGAGFHDRVENRRMWFMKTNYTGQSLESCKRPGL